MVIPGGVGGDERQGDPRLVVASHEMVRIGEPEGEADHRSHRAEGDVALFPVEPDAGDFLPPERPPADHAGVGDGGGVAPRLGAGQGEAGDFLPPCQAGEVVLLLRIRPVAEQQLRGTEGIGDHHRHRRRDAPAGDLHDHLGMGQGGEAFPAVLFRDDHPEKAPLLDELPGFRGEIAQLGDDPPVVEHPAELLHRAGEEGLLLVGQFRLRLGQELLPVGVAAEQLPVPPDRPRLQRLPFGPGEGGEHPLEQGKERFHEEGAAHLGNVDQRPQPPGRGARRATRCRCTSRR